MVKMASRPVVEWWVLQNKNGKTSPYFRVRWPSKALAEFVCRQLLDEDNQLECVWRTEKRPSKEELRRRGCIV